MRVVSLLVVSSLACTLTLTPASLVGQEAEMEPVTHYLAVTTFHVPYNDDQDKVSWWIDSVMVPNAKMNPNVLSFRVGNHIYGSSGGDVILLTEYADWPAINADCEPCNAWFENRQPAEGTPEREAWDEAQAMFFKYFSGHDDEIYAVNMSRAK